MASTSLSPICWVCGKKLGSIVRAMDSKTTCAVVRDPIGNEHRCHHVCVKDADGVQVRTEPVKL